jgi:hypothetical protein
VHAIYESKKTPFDTSPLGPGIYWVSGSSVEDYMLTRLQFINLLVAQSSVDKAIRGDSLTVQMEVKQVAQVRLQFLAASNGK